MRRLAFFMLAALIAAITSATAGVKNVAVVETELDAQSGAAAKINRAEVRQITAALRSAAVRSLPSGKYNIMTQETVMAQGSAKLEECSEENCVITLGSKIGADYIVRGVISKLGTNLTMAVEMFETEDGNLVESSGVVRAGNVTELLDKTETACADMYKRFLVAQGSAPKAAVTPAAPPTPATYTITAVANPSHGGAVSRNPYQASYAAGTIVSVTATPASGYEFVGWSGASSATTATLKAPIDRDLALTANFRLIPTPAPTPAPVPAPPPQPQYQPSTPSIQSASSTVDANGTLTDGRDGKKYKTVVIGGKRWMGENLNYQTISGSWCYENAGSNCNKYGRLYDWNTAKAVCPKSWHLPSRQEWDELVKASGGNKAGKNLKSESGWNNRGNGKDKYGFSALPGGRRYSGGSFYGAGSDGGWWTATEYGSGYA